VRDRSSEPKLSVRLAFKMAQLCYSKDSPNPMRGTRLLLNFLVEALQQSTVGCGSKQQKQTPTLVTRYFDPGLLKASEERCILEVYVKRA
jgi:hypothetical protein